VHLVTRHPEGWQELRVTVREGRFAYEETPADAELLAQVARQIVGHEELPVGYVTEVHGVACGFMATLSRMLRNGGANAAFLFDYGFPAHEYYLDLRATGTLMCHYRHHAHADPFYYPGLQDITAHVDFTAMALAAQDAGVEVLAYLNQSGFLIGAGIGELLLRTDPSDVKAYLPQASALQKLVSPAEMGELFKVLAIGKNVALPDAVAMHDRSHRL
jgi:SAM-dependent MidA family methyltransferase